MKAVQIQKPGGIDALEYADVPIPKPKAEEVLVRNEFVGINYIDTYRPQAISPVHSLRVRVQFGFGWEVTRRYMRSGLYPAPSLPLILGGEGAGIIDSVGEGVTTFKKGERVAYMSGAVHTLLPTCH